MVHKCENGKLRVHYDKKRFIIEAIVMYLPGFLMVLALLTPFSGFSQIVHDSKTVFESFLTPDAHAKPMARMWFPDASAGEDDNDYIEKQISELAAKGFGGVEVAMIMTYGVRYDNEDTRVYGWGTDNWIKLMKKVLKAAAKVPGGFQVDATITSHWPPLLNTIDPNDDAASKELSFSVTPITADDMENGTIKLELDEGTAPITVENFIKLAKDGFYDGLTFHRIIDGFMIQGGDPLGNATGGSKDNIKGEFSTNGVNNPISHVKGIISMARANDPDSASSQFFITVADSTFLDGSYAAFGRVTEGMDVAEKIAKDAKPVDNNGTIPADKQPVIEKIVITD
jgi:cyclophilin family peptidyl-prolyl cis-trans isomerase